MGFAACVCLALCVVLATSAVFGSSYRESDGEPCQPDKLTVYKVILHTFWAREKFPKHYPDWRPPAQWSKVFGEFARRMCVRYYIDFGRLSHTLRLSSFAHCYSEHLHLITFCSRGLGINLLYNVVSFSIKLALIEKKFFAWRNASLRLLNEISA